MKEAQRFPDDFDGIIAGAPGLDWTGRAAQASGSRRRSSTTKPARLSTKRQTAAASAPSLEACDALDGVKDGLIDDPERCRFDPGVLQCTGADAPDCLTAGAGRDRPIDLLAGE